MFNYSRYDNFMAQTKLVKPEWLERNELENWLSLVTLMNLLSTSLDAQLNKDSGISHFDYMILSLLGQNDDRTMRLSEIAHRTAGSISRVSHAITKLEKQNWVERRPCPQDARATNAYLTREGFAAWLASAPKHLELVKSLMFDSLSAQERETLKVLAQKLSAKLDPTGQAELLS
jgi:DNA-binding MarR family transcriptional regulator